MVSFPISYTSLCEPPYGPQVKGRLSWVGHAYQQWYRTSHWLASSDDVESTTSSDDEGITSLVTETNLDDFQVAASQDVACIPNPVYDISRNVVGETVMGDTRSISDMVQSETTEFKPIENGLQNKRQRIGVNQKTACSRDCQFSSEEL